MLYMAYKFPLNPLLIYWKHTLCDCDHHKRARLSRHLFIVRLRHLGTTCYIMFKVNWTVVKKSEGHRAKVQEVQGTCATLSAECMARVNGRRQKQKLRETECTQNAAASHRIVLALTRYLFAAARINVSHCHAQICRVTFMSAFVRLSVSAPGCQLTASVCLLPRPLTDSRWRGEAWSVSLSWPDFKIDGLARTPRTHSIGKTGLSLLGDIVPTSSPRCYQASEMTHLWVMVWLNRWSLQSLRWCVWIWVNRKTHTRILQDTALSSEFQMKVLLSALPSHLTFQKKNRLINDAVHLHVNKQMKTLLISSAFLNREKTQSGAINYTKRHWRTWTKVRVCSLEVRIPRPKFFQPEGGKGGNGDRLCRMGRVGGAEWMGKDLEIRLCLDALSESVMFFPAHWSGHCRLIRFLSSSIKVKFNKLLLFFFLIWIWKWLAGSGMGVCSRPKGKWLMPFFFWRPLGAEKKGEWRTSGLPSYVPFAFC